MRKALFCLVAVLSTAAWGQEERLGLFLQGNRVGTATYRTSIETVNNRALRRADSTTLMEIALLATPMKMKMNSVSWTDPKTGKPVRMTFNQESDGRSQKVDAHFEGSKVLVDVNNSGTITHETLAIPNGNVVDDPLTDMLASGVTKKTATFFVLDPTTVTFVKNTVEIKGPSDVEVNGKTRQATLVVIDDPRASMNVYVDVKGEVVKIEGPAGIEMIPEAADTPEKPSAPPTTPIDLADVTSIPVHPAIDDATTVSFLELSVTGHNLSALPSDDHQTVKKKGDGWDLAIHPPKIAGSEGVTIQQAAKQMPQWLKPSLNIPSASPAFKKLAARVTKGKTHVRDASLAIRQYVHHIMTPNAGIGVLRDATEVLKTKEGVCRDYAVLTATLLRAANIPAKVSSGLVYYDGRLYYHAWADAWDGKRWIGLDSTVPEDQISAGHVELATGSVEQAFNFTFLDKIHVNVLKVGRG
jgi:transglutaminase-like putative cysteine protease